MRIRPVTDSSKSARWVEPGDENVVQVVDAVQALVRAGEDNSFDMDAVVVQWDVRGAWVRAGENVDIVAIVGEGIRFAENAAVDPDVGCEHHHTLLPDWETRPERHRW